MSSNNIHIRSTKGILSWIHEINSDQWKAFYAPFSRLDLDAMDLLLFAFAVGSIGQVFNLSETMVWGSVFSNPLCISFGSSNSSGNKRKSFRG